MKHDIEAQLREALRPVTPSEEFTQRLIAAVNAQATTAGSHQGTRRAAPLWWACGLAASLIIAVGAGQHLRAQRELANGLEARRQVLQALHMTSQKLDLAYKAVKNESSSLVDVESGA